VVSVPTDTPRDATVCIGGNLEELGQWKPDGVRLERGSDGKYRGTVRVSAEARLEYKITQGAWQTVEKSGAGLDIANRKFVAERDTKLEIGVESWTKSTSPKRELEPSISGDVRTHHKFRSKISG
jgi:hypothetical protein